MIRSLVRIALLLSALFFCLIPHLLRTLTGRRSLWPRRFLSVAAKIFGARVIIDGYPVSGDRFYISNHVSWIDILVLGGATGTAFVAKDGIAKWPIVGWLAKQNNTVFIARDKRGTLHTQLDGLRQAMHDHQPLTIFPEGTTSDGKHLLPFKPALLSALTPPPRALSVQPIHIDYGSNAAEIAWFGDEPAMTNLKRILKRKGTFSVTLHFLQAFDPASVSDRKQLSKKVFEEIAFSIAAHPPSSSENTSV